MIQQGHAYRWSFAKKVIALESVRSGQVQVVEVRHGWPSTPFYVFACDLVPLPMVYFHGQIPLQSR